MGRDGERVGGERDGERGWVKWKRRMGRDGKREGRGEQRNRRWERRTELVSLMKCPIYLCFFTIFVGLSTAALIVGLVGALFSLLLW